MTDWEVTVITDSNYIKKVRVNDCVTRTDAEAAALGMTGAQRVVVSNPKTYYDESSGNHSSSSNSNNDALGYLVIGALILFFAFWKFFLVIGIASFLIWLIFKIACSQS